MKNSFEGCFLGAQRLDAACETRDLPRRGVLVHDALLGRAHHLRLGSAQGGRGLGLVAGSDGLFNLADEGPHAAATRLVDRGALRDLAGHLLGGHGVGHGPSSFFKIPMAKLKPLGELRQRSVDCMETEEPAGRAGSCEAAYRRDACERQRPWAFARQKSAKRPWRQGLAGSSRSLRAIRLDTTTRRGRMS